MPDIDRVLEQIAAEPPVADLTTIEAEVWAKINHESAAPLSSPIGIGQVQALRSTGAAVLGALAVGVAIGVASLHGPVAAGPMSAFSASTPYAPSTILGGRTQ